MRSEASSMPPNRSRSVAQAAIVQWRLRKTATSKGFVQQAASNAGAEALFGASVRARTNCILPASRCFHPYHGSRFHRAPSLRRPFPHKGPSFAGLLEKSRKVPPCQKLRCIIVEKRRRRLPSEEAPVQRSPRKQQRDSYFKLCFASSQQPIRMMLRPVRRLP